MRERRPPERSGLAILPWTLAPMFVATFAGAMSDTVSPKRILGIGLTLQAVGLGWIAFVTAPSAPYIAFVIPFILAGVGMGLCSRPWVESGRALQPVADAA